MLLNNMLDQTNLRALADNKINLAQKLKFV